MLVVPRLSRLSELAPRLYVLRQLDLDADQVRIAGPLLLLLPICWCLLLVLVLKMKAFCIARRWDAPFRVEYGLGWSAYSTVHDETR